MNEPKRNSFPPLLAAVILVFLFFTGWSVWMAVKADPAVTDPDYYSKGLKYNRTLIEKRAAASLGWNLTTSLERGQLRIELRDRQGRPVPDATGEITLFSARSRTQQLPLRESGPGIYSVRLPAGLAGELRARIEFDRQGVRLMRDLLLNI
ncbi:FixH protein [Geothermobacter ehrlichii]|uniref:FixH protein n=1 Tax=Geothermobacter ehrlichii TaxID=213224 RepID=A0A5D3WLD4_9BACT|nr:FixH family protein [Geothermobacter ehrlichii]TYO98773.1 FixH protein [Geothermobacter ehrlichii]